MSTVVSTAVRKTVVARTYLGRTTYSTYNNASEYYTESLKESVDTGVFTPGFYRINPYHISSEVWEHTNVTDDSEALVCSYTGRWNVHYESVSTGQYMNRCFNSVVRSYFGDPDFSDFSNLANRTLNHVYSKVARSDLGIGETLGEYKETLQMLRSPLKSLRDFLTGNDYRNVSALNRLTRYLKTGTFSRKGKVARDSAKAAADTWLEMRYGIRPLIMTVQDVIEYIEEREKKLFDPKAIRSRRSIRSETDQDKYSGYDLSLFFSQGGLDISLNATKVDIRTVNASVQYRCAFAPTLFDELGLSAQHWPEIAWELTRLSFVVDWLFEIGPWLSARRINPGVTILGNTVGYKLERSITVDEASARPHIDEAANVGEDFTDNSSYKLRSYERKTNVQLPLLPQFSYGDTIDLFRTIDALSLIMQPALRKLNRR